MLDEAGKERLSKVRRTAIFEEGETIYRQSDKSGGILCVETGNILLRQYDKFGNETDFGIVTNGETIGWRSHFSDQGHAATAVALTPCRICLIPGAQLTDLLHDYFDLSMAFLKSVAKDRGPQEGLLLRNPNLPVRIRLINFMLILARQMAPGQHEGEICFILPISRRQIAAMVGIRIETLSRSLASLAEEGLFEANGRRVTIFDRQCLIKEVAFDLPS